MDRAALVEALAKETFERGVEPFVEGWTWDNSPEQYREAMCRIATEKQLPLIVAFVAGWLDAKEAYLAAHDVGIDPAGDEQSQTASWLGWQWRKEMGA